MFASHTIKCGEARECVRGPKPPRETMGISAWADPEPPATNPVPVETKTVIVSGPPVTATVKETQTVTATPTTVKETVTATATVTRNMTTTPKPQPKVTVTKTERVTATPQVNPQPVPEVSATWHPDDYGAVPSPSLAPANPVASAPVMIVQMPPSQPVANEMSSGLLVTGAIVLVAVIGALVFVVYRVLKGK